MISLIRVGTVVSVNAADCTARVEFEDLQGMVSAELPILQAAAGAYQTYSLPNINDHVICVFLDNGEESGFILGAIYNDQDTPHDSGPGLRYIKFSDGGELLYDTGTHVLSIGAAGGVNIVGPVTITGDVSILGALTVENTITATGIVTAPAFVEG